MVFPGDAFAALNLFGFEHNGCGGFGLVVGLVLAVQLDVMFAAVVVVRDLECLSGARVAPPVEHGLIGGTVSTQTTLIHIRH